MDQKRLPLFIALSLAILLGFQYFGPHRPPPHPAVPVHAAQSGSAQSGSAHGGTPDPGAKGVASAPASGQAGGGDLDVANAPRVTIDGPRVVGSISLLGARLDDLRLKEYHETVSKSSPLVRLLSPAGAPEPSYVQFGWSAPAGVALPGNATLWTSSGGTVALNHPVTLSWDNKAGLVFQISLSIDRDYLFHVSQSVRNSGSAAVQLWPWERIHRDFEPAASGYSMLYEGLLGVMDDRLHDVGYSKLKSAAEKDDGIGYQHEDAGGWAGFTDKYWLTALVPPQNVQVKTSWTQDEDGAAKRYQVSYETVAPEQVAPGGSATYDSRVFVGAKEVHLLDHYETQDHIPLLSYAVDWGWFYFLTKPFYYAIDFLYSLCGNFGVAILLFTLGVKILFYPIAARSYRQMGKMRLLGPKITQVRERYKDDPAKLQSEMMSVYKAENVSPVSGCAPMLLQIPVFFSLYKVILITIEMRHAAFFGWIHDLSATDPTNVFNLFGLLPFDPSAVSPYLHLGIWPLIMGGTMYLQQRLNPPAPDPAQAKILQFMPLIFMFTMGRFPAGLVIYWSWNNTLTFAQQWYIQRQAKLTPRGKAVKI